MNPNSPLGILRLARVVSSQIHSPLLGDKVDYGMGLLYCPARM
jgi:hypothetical protein